MKMRTFTWSISISILLVLILSCVLVVTLAVPAWRQDRPVVSTQQGQVRGVWASDGDYAMFMGIQYALVNPENPFGDALPGPIFEEIFEANDDSVICTQIEEFNNTLTGDLDCLNINVYVPRSASVSNPLPVMVYIYGGGFSTGFASRYVLGPQYLVRHDVILVTLNYRLGPYGFMCLDTPSVPGNAGLKDQRRGLEWVQNNIAAFGGDTSRVTIFGNSAGAISVEFHILSDGSNGLFHQAILESGSAVYGQSVGASKPTAPLELAKYLELEAETMEDALDLLKYVPSRDVVQAGIDLGITFGPCIEQIIEGVENIITVFPERTLASGQFESVPMIVGYNTDEMLIQALMMQENYFENLQTFIHQQVGSIFAFESEQQLERVQNVVKEFYFGTKSINEDTVYNLIKFYSDSAILSTIERSLKYHMASSNLPIYQYLFAYSGEINFSKYRLNITENGAAHADEITYLFKAIYMPDVNTPEDQLIADRMTTMWTNFAKYGDPTPEVNELLPVRWPVVTEERGYLWIDSELKADQKPFHSRIAFWDLLFEAFGQ